MKVCHLTSVHQRFDIRIFKKECVSLSHFGFDVSLVVADGLDDEVVDNVKIYGVPKETSRIKRFIKATRNVYRKAIEIDADIYHFHDAELLPIGNKLKRLGKKVVFDSHEDLPRQILSKPYLPKYIRKSLAAILEKYEDYCCKKYDAIVTATPYINKRFLKINNNSVNINNYPFLNEFNVEASNVSKQPNAICYIGGITKIRGLDYVVGALKKTEAKLELAGGISPNSYKDELTSKGGWEKVNYHGNVSREKVKEILNQSMAGIVTFLPVPNHINAQPNKLFEYMSSSIPVIASHYPLWKGIVERYDCGICVNPENSEEIVEAINYITANPLEAKRKGTNGRKAIEEVFNWEHEELKLQLLYREL
ncbi:MAG: glycosyltransferase family 4 protein [Flavobacteriaceae bacterium]|uniref:glycosyltransferase family 4 protein n=1 Tax=Flagellimonas TaxID=444459 RepID=UPI003BAB1C4C|nr:glycosyltransferase family 4 protein [Flavobacteriaceae bacterium]